MSVRKTGLPASGNTTVSPLIGGTVTYRTVRERNGTNG